MPAVSAKRGVDDGNQKIGALSSRHKRAVFIISDVVFSFGDRNEFLLKIKTREACFFLAMCL